MNAASRYIHYFDEHAMEGYDSPLGIGVLRDIKQNMTANWYKAQHRKNRRLLNQREKELNQDLSLNFNQIQKELSNIFNQQNIEATTVGLHGKTIQGVRRESTQYNAASVAKDFAKILSNNEKQLGDFVNLIGQVLRTIDTIHDKLGLAQVSSLIMDHAEFPNKDIAEYLRCKEGKEIYIDNASIINLGSHYENLRTAITGLKGFKTEMKSSRAKTETMQDLLKAIQGALNATKGILLEAELYAGLCKASFEGLDLIDIQMTGSIGKIKKDPKIDIDKAIWKKAAEIPSFERKNPNSDITMAFDSNGATAYLGISVKNHHTKFENLPEPKDYNKYDFAQVLSIGSKANLYEQIEKASRQLKKITNVDPIFYGQQAFGIHKREQSGPNAGTASYWEDYLDAVAVLNILDRLAGEGGTTNFSRFLVLNGMVYSIDEVLLEIAKNPTLVYGTSVIQYVGRGINKWEKETAEDDGPQDAAKRRSEKAGSKMIQRWKEATLSTKIHLSILANLRK